MRSFWTICVIETIRYLGHVNMITGNCDIGPEHAQALTVNNLPTNKLANETETTNLFPKIQCSFIEKSSNTLRFSTEKLLLIDVIIVRAWERKDRAQTIFTSERKPCHCAFEFQTSKLFSLWVYSNFLDDKCPTLSLWNILYTKSSTVRFYHSSPFDVRVTCASLAEVRSNLRKRDGDYIYVSYL